MMSRLSYFSVEAASNFTLRTLLFLDVHTGSLLCVHQAGLGGEEARRAQHAQRRLPDPHLISHSHSPPSPLPCPGPSPSRIIPPPVQESRGADEMDEEEDVLVEILELEHERN